MSKTLSQLAKEYDDAIEQLRIILEKTELKRKKARLEKNEDEHQRLVKLIGIYREELRDMRIISDTLRHYYDEDDKNRGIAV